MGTAYRTSGRGCLGGRYSLEEYGKVCIPPTGHLEYGYPGTLGGGSSWRVGRIGTLGGGS
eukprot:584751-Rhodomonas_salina.2